MQCQNCGRELPPAARFCTTCGAPQTIAAPPAGSTPPSPGYYPPPSSAGSPPPASSAAGHEQYVQSQPGQSPDLPDPTVAVSGRGPSGISYRIVGTTLQAAIIELEPGQIIYSESGGMSWMSGNIAMNTHSGGGIGGMFKRAISGESLFIVDFTCTGGRGLVAFASEFPGKIVPLQLAPGQQLVCQKDAFMCAEKSVTLEMHFRRKLGAGLFGGEGFILQKLTGPGLAFIELDGEVVEYVLQPGQVLKVDTGHVAMFEPSVDFDIEMVRGFKNILFGGEGLFLATLRGPGKVWLQTMPIVNVARKVAEYLPGGGGGNSGSGIGDVVGGLFGGD